MYFLHKATSSEHVLIFFKSVPCDQRDCRDFTFCVKTVMKYVLSLISQANSPPNYRPSARWGVAYVDVCVIKVTVQRLLVLPGAITKCLTACFCLVSYQEICYPNRCINSVKLSRANLGAQGHTQTWKYGHKDTACAWGLLNVKGQFCKKKKLLPHTGLRWSLEGKARLF